MKTLYINLKSHIRNVVKSTFDIDIEDVTLEFPQNIEHGHFAANIAMQLTKSVQKNPREIAQNILDNFGELEGVEKVEIAGPGFINFFVTEEQLVDFVFHAEKIRAKNIVEKPRKIVSDISHPNAAKPMGTHHLLSTLIGDAINNLLEHVGHNITRDSYWGDWGTQFGKLIYAYKNWGDDDVIQKDPINELLKLYIDFHNRVEDDSSLNDSARLEFKKLEDGNEENLKIWKWIVSLSKEEFFTLYKRLNIHFDTYLGESHYVPYIDKIIEEGKAKKIFVDGEMGALVVRFENEKIPTCPIVKSDGATLYHTRDLTRIKYWKDKEQIDEMLYVVDAAQSMHFTQLFEMSKMFGWNDVACRHAVFGRMRFKDGSMSTRKGNIVLMKDVLDEAEKRAHTIIESRDTDLNENEKNELSRIMGISSVKYSILMQNRITDIVFDWDKMLSFEGNSAPYMQYTYARGRSILRKAEVRNESDEKLNIELCDKDKELTLELFQFPHVVMRAAQEYMPHILCNYMYQLSQTFNSFYNSTPVLNADCENTKNFRIHLVEAVCNTLQESFELLGMEAPERM